MTACNALTRKELLCRNEVFLGYDSCYLHSNYHLYMSDYRCCYNCRNHVYIELDDGQYYCYVHSILESYSKQCKHIYSINSQYANQQCNNRTNNDDELCHRHRRYKKHNYQAYKQCKHIFGPKSNLTGEQCNKNTLRKDGLCHQHRRYSKYQ
jgi:hypothetical protein